jgi:hypothetical protein
VRPWRAAGVGHDERGTRVVNYIDAGYAIAFGVLAAYAALLWRRRQRLERAASRWRGPQAP